MAQPQYFIDDDYTETGDVPAFGRRPGFTITYRPALLEDMEEYRIAADAARARRDHKKVKEVTVKLLSDHVTAWTIPDPAGGKDFCAVTAALLAKIAPPQLDAMTNLVGGYTEARQAADEKN